MFDEIEQTVMSIFESTREGGDAPARVAFGRGYGAYWARLAATGNPHTCGTPEYAAWDDGWSQAQFDDGESTAEG